MSNERTSFFILYNPWNGHVVMYKQNKKTRPTTRIMDVYLLSVHTYMPLNIHINFTILFVVDRDFEKNILV